MVVIWEDTVLMLSVGVLQRGSNRSGSIGSSGLSPRYLAHLLLSSAMMNTLVYLDLRASFHRLLVHFSLAIN